MPTPRCNRPAATPRRSANRSAVCPVCARAEYDKQSAGSRAVAGRRADRPGSGTGVLGVRGGRRTGSWVRGGAPTAQLPLQSNGARSTRGARSAKPAFAGFIARPGFCNEFPTGHGRLAAAPLLRAVCNAAPHFACGVALLCRVPIALTPRPDRALCPPRSATHGRAPEAIKQVIAAGNAIATLPYIYGGGHASFQADGYDCSGSVSYALAAAGLVTSPMVSGSSRTGARPDPVSGSRSTPTPTTCG
jgi:hypothetical protein